MTSHSDVEALALPACLADRGYALRRQRPDDYAFLEGLYASARAPELALVAWPERDKRTFLVQQHRLQHAHYARYYADAEFLILEASGRSVGRLCLFRAPTDIRVVDVALLPQARNRGVGTALLEAVVSAADASGRSVSIHVEKFNPAQTLYRRLGFREIGESGPYWLMEWRAEGPSAAA